VVMVIVYIQAKCYCDIVLESLYNVNILPSYTDPHNLTNKSIRLLVEFTPPLSP